MKVSRDFKEAFDLVHQAFRTSPEEIEEAKVLVRADFEGSESAYLATAALIRAGWKPLDGGGQAAAFIASTNDPEVIARFSGERKAA